MNVSQTSGASAAWALQRLFQSTNETSSSTAAEGAGRQKMPSADGRTCNSSGSASPTMSGQTMSGMMSLQMEAPSTEDIASDIVSGLDTNGDGELSADEITSAISKAGLDASSAESALAAIDADSSGALSATELASAIEADRGARGPKGPPPGGPPPSAEETATGILSAFDSDGSDTLGVDEVLSALGEDTDEDGELTAAFDSLDTDGDGQLSAAELSAALQARMDAGYRAYAQASLAG